jgi:hypothetical protein
VEDSDEDVDERYKRKGRRHQWDESEEDDDEQTLPKRKAKRRTQQDADDEEDEGKSAKKKGKAVKVEEDDEETESDGSIVSLSNVVPLQNPSEFRAYRRIMSAFEKGKAPEIYDLNKIRIEMVGSWRMHFRRRVNKWNEKCPERMLEDKEV